MQTFAPSPIHVYTAADLDYRRLGKQRVETLQILNALLIPTKKRGWKNHPAVKQWIGHEGFLIEYGLTMCKEWIRRGYKDTCTAKIGAFYDNPEVTAKTKHRPDWWGNEAFHSSHRAALLFKDEKWYSQFGWKEKPVYDYWWPTENGY